ncbi:MAG TPA: alpha/beta hydrolase fold domain-containing protein [Acidobacteriaceae bacterium]|jgi:acetyl esterase/lipase|nr:alpha/beta hydrolase fold domain-containing protein [Acidobacteriaceae bacterium]
MKALVASLLLLSASAFAQQGTTAAQAPNADTSYIDPQGAAHITRVVPIPPDLSPEARAMLARPTSDANIPQSLAQRRHGTDVWQNHAGDVSAQLYPVHRSESTIAGVPVRLIMPVANMDPDHVLLNIHGGGFNSDSGSWTETIPMANLTRMKVVAVLYRLAPEHPFPAGLDDVVSVYKELLKTYKPSHIAIYGTSAGAILTPEVAVKLRQLHLPLPGALGIFSGMGDFSRMGDSIAMYALNGLSGHLEPPSPNDHDSEYVGSTSLTDPVLSPVFADLRNMPPTLFITSGRDLLLSGTANLQRAFLRAGNHNTQMVLFDALPHAFWNNPNLPESKEADRIMANFFLRSLHPASR